MRLIDAVLAHDQRHLWAHVEIQRHSPFSSDHGVRACFGLEYLAQAAAAFFTLQASEANPPKQGMLIACRRFDTAVAVFPLASRLLLSVSLTSAMPAAAEGSALVKFQGEIHILQPDRQTPTSSAACARVAATRATTVADLSVYL
jgi:predicted hotdog family 3-hydroxylacyl-ACP dehydratase